VTQPGQDGGEVGERAAHPALVHKRHARAGRFFGDRVLRLLLGANKQHRFAFGCLLANEVHGFVEAAHGLLQVDDVDSVAFSKNERPHAGIPAACLMAEVDAGFQQRLHLNRCRHGSL
jgi:hypothetical protein